MDGEEHIHGQRSTRPEGPRVTTQWPSKQMGRVRNWGLPVRFARMLHEVQGFTPARIEVRPSAGSNARHAPTWTKMQLSSRTSAVNSMPRRDPREIPSTKTWTDNA